MRSLNSATYVDSTIRRKTFDERGSLIGKTSNVANGKADVTTSNGGVYRAIRLPDQVDVENDVWVNLERSGMGYYISGIAPHGSGA